MSLWSESQGSGPELVLLHGWGMNAAVWEPLLPLLRAKYRVTRIELPGHGESPVLGPSLQAWAESCLDVAPQRAFWLGWSLGGLVAQQVALSAPDRVSGLGLVTATPSFVQRDDWRHAMPPEVFEQFASALMRDPRGTLKRFLGLQVKGAEDARTLLRTLTAAQAQRPAPGTRGLEHGLDVLLEGDLREQLQHLRVPVSWLFGSRDTLVPAAVAASISSRLPSTQVSVVEGAAHAPFLSHPQPFLSWLESSHV